MTGSATTDVERTIVVANDEFFRETLLDVLNEVGVDALAYDSATAALRARCRASLVLVDLNRRGWTRELKRLVRSKYLACARIVAFVDPGATVPANVGIVQKPFALEDLAVLISAKTLAQR